MNDYGKTVSFCGRIGRRNHTETSKVRASAAGTASHTPVRPNIRGSTVRNKNMIMETAAPPSSPAKESAVRLNTMVVIAMAS